MVRSKDPFLPDFNSRRAAGKGDVGYDNPRENIDPHIKTKVVSTKELTSGASVKGDFDIVDTLTANKAAIGENANTHLDDNTFFSIRGGNFAIHSPGGEKRLLFGGASLDFLNADLRLFDNAEAEGVRLSTGVAETSFVLGKLVIGKKTTNEKFEVVGTISGANIFSSNSISGAFIFGDGSNLTNLPGGSSTTQWTSGAGIMSPIIRTLPISGAGLITGNTISGGNLVLRHNLSGVLAKLIQNDASGAFIDFQGTEDNTDPVTEGNISTLGVGGDSDLEGVSGPKIDGSMAGGFVHSQMVKIEINGAEHWIAAYTFETGGM